VHGKQEGRVSLGSPHGQGYTHFSRLVVGREGRSDPGAHTEPAWFESGWPLRGSVGSNCLICQRASSPRESHWLAALEGNGLSVKDRAKCTSSCLSLAWGRVVCVNPRQALARRMPVDWARPGRRGVIGGPCPKGANHRRHCAHACLVLLSAPNCLPFLLPSFPSFLHP